MNLKYKTAMAAAALLVTPMAFAAENYPTRPLRMIVPFPPGGGTDIMARMVGQRLTDAFGVRVVVDNRGGAAGNYRHRVGGEGQSGWTHDDDRLGEYHLHQRQPA